MNYEEEYKTALGKAKHWHKEGYGRGCQEVVEDIFPELKGSEDERIRKELMQLISCMHDADPRKKDWIAWLEKQGEKKDNNKLTWKHWSTGIAGNGDGKPIYLIKHYNTYSISSCLSSECDYILLSDLDKLISDGDNKKITNKNEPKFKVGNWYQCTKDFFSKGVAFDKNTAYYCAKEGCLHKYGCHIAIVKNLYDNFKLWDISDAKDGDVLYSLDSKQPFIFKHRNPNEQAEVYCGINIYGKFFVGNTKDCIITTDKYVPATKEQRDLLFQKMKEAGYEWDAEKRELKKIEDEDYNGEDYGIDSLYHALRILKKTLGKVDGYQTDDGILSHQCAISAVKKLYEQKPAEWSEEDEKMLDRIDESLYYYATKLRCEKDLSLAKDVKEEQD